MKECILYFILYFMLVSSVVGCRCKEAALGCGSTGDGVDARQEDDFVPWWAESAK